MTLDKAIQRAQADGDVEMTAWLLELRTRRLIDKGQATLLERFAMKVDTRGPIPAHRPDLGPCHIWIGSRNEHDYGKIYLGGRSQKSPRVAFFLKHGRWPEPEACHHCDNPPCVNAEHIFEGTRAENMRDMASKGRSGAHTHPERLARGDASGARQHPERMSRGDAHYSRARPERLARGERHGSRTRPEMIPRGARNGRAILTPEEVLEIRVWIAAGETQTDVSMAYGVSLSTTNAIVRGRLWSHVKGP